MKFNCGDPETKAKKRFEKDMEIAKELSKWHRVFAWFPVRVGKEDCRWLEHVERRASYYVFGSDLYRYHSPNFTGFEYRAINED